MLDVVFSQYRNYRGYLSAVLVQRMQANPSYSMRAFARSLGLSAGELSEVLRGKRKLSLRSAERVAEGLHLDAKEREHLVRLVLDERRDRAPASLVPLDGPEPPKAKRELTEDRFGIVADWYCFAILNLAQCEGFRWDEAHIARRLGIKRTEAREALERLENVGLLKRSYRGLEVDDSFVMSPDGIPSEAIRAYHKQILAKAAVALDEQPVEEREIAGVSFAINFKLVGPLKKELSQFLDHIAQKYGAGKKRTEVMHVELACFRLSRGTPDV